MGRRWLERPASVALVALAFWGAWAYATWAPGPPGWRRPAPPEPRLPFHALHRSRLPPAAGEGFCASCHGAAPHRAAPGTRAFLNLHVVTLDCGACHLGGRGVGVRRFRGDEAVTRRTLGQSSPSAPPDRLYAARPAGTGWERVDRPGGPVRFRARGPACRECHRRGSPWLAVDGLYDAYRRRVLEDLSVFRWLGTRGP